MQDLFQWNELKVQDLNMHWPLSTIISHSSPHAALLKRNDEVKGSIS